MQAECTKKDFPDALLLETLQKSTAENYQPETGLSREVSLVRIFPSLVKALGWMVADRDSGSSTPVSLAKYDHDSQSWKTSERLLTGDLIEFSGALPKSGMMRNGRIYALPMSERPIAGRESGLLPTPDCQNHRDGTKIRKDCNIQDGGRHGVSLHHAVQWSTPTANDAKNSLTDSQRGRGTLTANMVERLWPTPRTAGMCGGTGNWNQLKDKCENIEEARKMGAGNGGQLNPTWVEWLMGYPLFWTEVADEVSAEKSRAKGIPDNGQVREVRVSGEPTEAPQRLQQADGSSNTLPGLPCESGFEGRDKAEEADAKMRNMREDVQPSGFTPTQDLRSSLLVETWQDECRESLAWDKEPDIGRVANGVKNRVDRLKCLGNSIVPQIAQMIFEQMLSSFPHSTTQKL